MKQQLHFIKTNKYLYIALTATLLFFFRKGIQYALLDSYIPLLVIIALALFIWVSIYLLKGIRLAIKIWSVFLILWALIKLLLFVAMSFLDELSNSHIYHQFGIVGLLSSILILCFGIYIFRKSRKLSPPNFSD
ncbi:hypothetical protein M0D21_01095 [Aquimarina sp. D1M17]|uniref:hypothetical protein n=1 Tax=Aquimarina acroporae TaxID=2937283 RepID=UPI0020C05655|nr:hypothetical protein [Aquimarina acroporae]MCK8520147.1 hypothetical protein [Aquimarina acroporae]